MALLEDEHPDALLVLDAERLDEDVERLDGEDVLGVEEQVR